MPEETHIEAEAHAPLSALEEFLNTAAEKVTDDVHRRLLKACLSPDPAASLEAEFQAIISKIVHEA